MVEERIVVSEIRVSKSKGCIAIVVKFIEMLPQVLVVSPGF